MNKEQAKERLCAIETEVEKLRRIIDEPEQRTPEAGDVWKVDGDDYIVGSDRVATSLRDGYTLTSPLEKYFPSSTHTYLGKFDEVFVKISDVRDALSVDGFLHYDVTFRESHEALRKLNIIKD